MNALLDAVCVRVRDWLPDLKECSVHDGRFTADEVRRWAIRTPAVRLACLGLASVGDSGDERSEPVLQLAAMVVTRDGAGMPRGKSARNLVDCLVSRVPRERWGLTGVGPAGNLRADNLYSGKIDKFGVALWAVLWRQTLRLPEAGDSEDCPPVPTELYLGESPEIGTGHESDYHRVLPEEDG